MFTLFITLFFILGIQSLLAQESIVEIRGKVVETKSQVAVQYATIKLVEAASGLLITGTTTNADGTFLMEIEVSDFVLEVGFIGFESKTITTIEIVEGKVDLGVITISEDTETLDEVVVQGEKSQTVFKLDKKVFSVG